MNTSSKKEWKVVVGGENDVYAEGEQVLVKYRFWGQTSIEESELKVEENREVRSVTRIDGVDRNV